MGNEQVSDEENQAGAGSSAEKKDSNDEGGGGERKEEEEEEDEECKQEEQQQVEEDNNKYPPYFYDPDTNDLMTDPVVHPCGKSYQKSTLAANVQEYCYPNRALKSYIEAEMERRQLHGTMIGKLKQWDGSLRNVMKQTIDKSALPSREYRPLPDYYYCPITYDLIEEPVIDSDGHTYEFDAIVEWIRQNGKSPVTRKPLQIDKLYDNLALEAILKDESKKVNEDSIHPSIRRWKEQLANKQQHRSIRDHVETTTDANTTADQNPTNRRRYATNPEELDERRQQYNSCACKTITVFGIIMVVVVLVLTIPSVGFEFILFVFIFFLEFCCSSSSSSSSNNNNNENS